MKFKYLLQSVVFVYMLLLSTHALSQQQAMYTQYMFNGLAINPAYAGSQGTMSLTALAREQWVGFEGAPSSQTFSLHAPLKDSKISLGMLLTHDQIGITDQYGAYGVYAYRLKLPKGSLSSGLQLGFNAYRAGFSRLLVQQGDDLSFSGDDQQAFLPNVGAGFYYHTQRFYAGFSLPYLLTNDYPGPEGSQAQQFRHCFFSSGYVFRLHPELQLKPNVLIKAVEGVPLEIDFNANLLIRDLVWVGASYRSFDALCMLLEIQATQQLGFGYAYDYTLTELRGTHSGSHEFMINYRLKRQDKKILTPRYF